MQVDFYQNEGVYNYESVGNLSINCEYLNNQVEQGNKIYTIRFYKFIPENDVFSIV